MTRPLLEPLARVFGGNGATEWSSAFRASAQTIADLDLRQALVRDGRLPIVSLSRLVGDLDHLGFLVPEFDVACVTAAAAAMGFERHRRFPSRVLAAELGARIGKEAIPLEVVKVFGRAGCIELFALGDGVPPALAKSWIAEGVGAHVALPLLPRVEFGDALMLLAEAGFVTPVGLGPTALDNRAEGVSVAYMDGFLGASPVRIELCRGHAR